MTFQPEDEADIPALAERAMFVMPLDDRPILPFYEGAYAGGFVALHPFFEIPGLDPALCEHGTHIVERGEIPTGADILAWAEQDRALKAVGKTVDADAVDLAAKLRGRPIGWREMLAAAGFADHAALNGALRTHIRGLRPQFADPEGAERLVRLCAQRRIFPPTEGMFQPVMENALRQFLEACDLKRIVWADEFDADTARKIDLRDLPRDKLWVAGAATPDYVPRRLFASDGSLFLCVHWDSFFTLILGSEERLAKGAPQTFFEGFGCSHETEIAWNRQEALPLVGAPRNG